MNYNINNPKFHEEVFKEVGNIVQECYNYPSDEEAEKLEMIHAIGSMEGDWYSFGLFFQIQNELFKIHQIKDKDDYESQIAIQQSGTDFLRKLKKIFTSYDHSSPTQIKIQYLADSEKVKYDFEYDLLWSNKEDCLSDDLYDEWFEEIKNGLSK